MCTWDLGPGHSHPQRASPALGPSAALSGGGFPSLVQQEVDVGEMAGGDLSVSLGVVAGWPSGRGNGGVRGHGHFPRCHSWKLTKAPPRWVPGTVPPGVLGSGSDSASPSAPPPQSSPTPGSSGVPPWLAPHPSHAGPSRTGSFRRMTSSWPSSQCLLTLECSEPRKGDATSSQSQESQCAPHWHRSRHPRQVLQRLLDIR